MLDSFSYETLEGMEVDMTNGLIQLLEVLDYTPQVPKLIVIDDLDFIARTPTVDRLSQGVWIYVEARNKCKFKFILRLVLEEIRIKITDYWYPTYSEALLITEADDPRPNPKVKQNRKNFYKRFGKTIRDLVAKHDIRYCLYY